MINYAEYLKSGEFLEATMENWESEFLQMGMYVLLTTFLFQKGSAESNKLEQGSEPPRRDAPWPVRRGGIAKRLYAYSLSIAFFALFGISSVLHAVGGAREYSEQQLAHGGDAVNAAQYICTLNSGSNRFKTGKANFSRSSRWLC